MSARGSSGAVPWPLLPALASARMKSSRLRSLAPDGTLTAVPVRSVQPLEFGPPTPLFQVFTSQRGIPGQKPPDDVTPDGQRFIVSAVVRRTDSSLHVLLNWPALMAK